MEQAAARGKPLSVLVLDIDYFKSINDSTATTPATTCCANSRCGCKKSIRGIDLACRYGGEEFVIVMPETDMAVAAMVAERLRRRIAGEPFPIEQGAKAIDVTLSIGIAALGARRGRRQACSSAPTRRSTGPSATAATGWCRTRPDRRARPKGPERALPLVPSGPPATAAEPVRSTLIFRTGGFSAAIHSRNHWLPGDVGVA